MLRLLRNLALILTAAFAAPAAYAAGISNFEIVGITLYGPAIVAMAACLLVRIYLWSVAKNKLLVYNVSLTLLAMLGTCVYVIEHDVGYSMAFAIGTGCGSSAVAAIEFAGSQFVANLKAFVFAGFKAPLDPPVA